MKTLIAVIVVSVVIAAAVSMNLDVFSTTTKAEGTPPTPENHGPPDFVPYMFLFQHLSTVKGRQWQVDQLRGKSGLSEVQFEKVMRVADEYAEEVAGYDEVAKGIIEDFHKKYPPGRMPEGQGPGDPPVELIELQSRRDDAAIRHREQLKIELGEEYEGFEKLVNVEVRSKISKGRAEPRYKETK